MGDGGKGGFELDKRPVRVAKKSAGNGEKRARKRVGFQSSIMFETSDAKGEKDGVGARGPRKQIQILVVAERRKERSRLREGRGDVKGFSARGGG